MKKKSNLLFVIALIGSILICSLMLVILFNASRKENEGKVKTIALASSQNIINQSDVEETREEINQETQTNDEKKLVSNEKNQENTDLKQTTGDTEGLISGTEYKSIDVKSGVKQIVIKASVDEVIVHQGGNKELEITQTYENLDKKDLFTVSELDDKLIIKTILTEDNFQLPGHNSPIRKSTLEINLPEIFDGELEVSSVVGNIVIKDELKLEEVSILSDVGDVIVEVNQSLKKAEIQSDVGNVEINGDWNVAESIVRTEIGNVTFHESVKVEKLSVDVEIGNIMIPSQVKEHTGCSINTQLGEIISY